MMRMRKLFAEHSQFFSQYLEPLKPNISTQGTPPVNLSKNLNR